MRANRPPGAFCFSLYSIIPIYIEIFLGSKDFQTWSNAPVEKDPQEFFAALGKNVRIIHGLLRQISKLEQDTITNAYKIDDLFKKLIQNLSEIPLKELRDELEGWINGKTRELEASKERFRSRFGGELGKILQQKLSLSLRGQSQKFYAGFYTSALDFDH